MQNFTFEKDGRIEELTREEESYKQKFQNERLLTNKLRKELNQLSLQRSETVNIMKNCISEVKRNIYKSKADFNSKDNTQDWMKIEKSLGLKDFSTKNKVEVVQNLLKYDDFLESLLEFVSQRHIGQFDNPPASQVLSRVCPGSLSQSRISRPTTAVSTFTQRVGLGQSGVNNLGNGTEGGNSHQTVANNSSYGTFGHNSHKFLNAANNAPSTVSYNRFKVNTNKKTKDKRLFFEMKV